MVPESPRLLDSGAPADSRRSSAEVTLAPLPMTSRAFLAHATAPGVGASDCCTEFSIEQDSPRHCARGNIQ